MLPFCLLPLIIVVAGGSVIEPVTQCFISGFKLNVDDLITSVEQSMAWAEAWKAECNCEALAETNKMFSKGILSASLIEQELPLFDPAATPPNPPPALTCKWSSFKNAYKSALAALIRARKLLNTIESFACKGLDSTALQSHYDQAVLLFHVTGNVIDTALFQCQAFGECEYQSPSRKTPINECERPCCNVTAVTKWGLTKLTVMTERSQGIFPFAAPAACNCCWEKTAYAIAAHRIQGTTRHVYEDLQARLLSPFKKSLAGDVRYCQEAGYPCEISAEWSLVNVWYPTVYSSLNYMAFGADLIAACAGAKLASDAGFALSRSQMLKINDIFGRYVTSLQKYCPISAQ